jgi:murein DD-endopeptidase MepM/ murein hydrolase activator NlpD
MRKKTKVFFFSENTLRLKEVKGARVKLVAFALCAAIVLVGFLVGFQNFSEGVLGIGLTKTTFLKNENGVLKAQLASLNDRLQILESALSRITLRDNELRVLADLPKMTDDILKAGTGGTKENYDFGLSQHANELLERTNTVINQLERQVQMQKTSYSQIVQKMEYNKEFFKHLPAIKPAEGYYSNGGFGLRLHPVFKDYRFHEGLDVTGEDGTSIYAAADGVVEFTGARGTYGKLIEIDHGYNYKTIYAHLSFINVREGQSVKRGTLIGRMGRTGVTTGTHLHYEVIKNGVRVNPVDYFFDEADYTRVHGDVASASHNH